MIKLISLDVDGTLLDSQGNLPDENRAVLQVTSERGVYIVLNTGKSLSAVNYLTEAINSSDPVIALGGALIVRKDDNGMWCVLNRTVLLEEVLDAFSVIFLDTNLTVIFLTMWHTYIYYRDRGPSCFTHMLKWLKLNDMNHYIVIDKSTLLSRTKIEVPILNIVLHEETPESDELKSVYSRLCRLKRRDILMEYSNLGTLNILPVQAGKRQAVEFLCKKLGIDQNEVMALGDYESDIDLVNWAGIGAIMENAPTSVKAKAPRIAPANDQCGVAWMINEFVLHKKS